jgi:hypothetical protein
MPEASIAPGPGAEQLQNARDIAGSPITGHLYTAENANFRVSEYTAWGLFVKAWGWDVAPEGAPGDTLSDGLEVCTTQCKQGEAGEGPGQLRESTGITLDAAGNVYVYDWQNLRVQKFSPAGQFLLTFGGKVNKTKVEGGGTAAEQNVCTAASGDVCQAGGAGPDDGYLASAVPNTLGNYIAYRSSTDSILVGDEGMVQEFGTDGSFKGKIELPGKTVEALDVDAAGNIYLAFSDLPNVYKLQASGEPGLPAEFGPVDDPGGITVDANGKVYVTVILDGSSQGMYVVGFEPTGAFIAGMEHDDEFAQPEFGGVFRNDLVGVGTNICAGSEGPNLYVAHFNLIFTSPPPRSYISAYGPPPIGCEPPPLRPPEISAQYAVAVDTDGATLRAQINPKFWNDTAYYVEYGISPCASGGCDKQQPPAPGAKLTSKVLNKPLTTAGVSLAGLEPGTTYHFRFIAQSSGGGPVVGIDPDGSEGPKAANSEEGLEGTFRTFPAEQREACPNDGLRTDAGATLPDCRAYEMVSPVEKANGDIAVGSSFGGYPQAYFASANAGERFTYTAATAFGDSASAPFASQYLARRDPQFGWMSEAISPPRERLLEVAPRTNRENEYKLFSGDLCQAWLRTITEPLLAPGAVPGFINLYRRENCASASYEALTVSPPDPDVSPVLDYHRLELQGVSADGSVAIYVAPDELSPDAPNNADKRPQLFRHTAGGEVEFVCTLPGGVPTNKPCYAGTIREFYGEGRLHNLQNAISDDGSRVFWTESDVETGPGRIFVRVEGEAGSRPVSTLVSGDNAVFYGAAGDGSKAIFAIDDLSPLDDNLYRLDVDAGGSPPPPVAEDLLGVLGFSEDASHLYFASTKVLTGEEENGEGQKAAVGEGNLYLDVEGEGLTFIGTLADADFFPIAPEPARHLARVSPDGAHAVFMSTAPLTGFDNTDANTGTPAFEVFLYDAESGELRCISCNPSGVRPSGENLRAFIGGTPTGIQAAAEIPAIERSLHGSRVLSEDGNRVFFESFEALVPRDSNGVKDVYQWERPGTGSCDEAAATFAPESGGCVDLISSGQSPRESSYVDSDASGDNVFFTTLSSLVPQDYGLIDVYDARVGGGFPPPTPPPPPCEGEACQSPPAPPEAPTPAGTSPGPGNQPPKRPCKRAKKHKKANASKARRCPRKHKANPKQGASR